MIYVRISGAVEHGIDCSHSYSGDDLQKLSWLNLYDLVLQDIFYRISIREGLLDGVEDGEDKFNLTDNEVYEYLEKLQKADKLRIISCDFYQEDDAFYDYIATLNVTDDMMENMKI